MAMTSDRLARVFLFLLLITGLGPVQGGDADRSARTFVGMRAGSGHPVIDVAPPLRLEGLRVERDGPLAVDGVARRVWGSSSYRGRVDVSTVSVVLHHDNDLDGYYQAFDLRLDVDTDGAVEWIYLKVYVSYEGGPWNLLHRSGEYPVGSHRFGNEIELTTFLDSGYPTGFYDFRIELFDADGGRWLRSLGPYDHSSLATLALEDGRRDDRYGDDGSGGVLSYGVAVQGSGAFGVECLLLPWLWRRFSVRGT